MAAVAGRAFSACGIPCYGAAARGLEGGSGRPLACVALQKAAACCPSAEVLASRSGKARTSPCTLLTSGCLWVRRTCLYWDGGANTSHENKTPKSRPCYACVYTDVCVHLSAGLLLQEVWPVGKS